MTSRATIPTGMREARRGQARLAVLVNICVGWVWGQAGLGQITASIGMHEIGCWLPLAELSCNTPELIL